MAMLRPLVRMPSAHGCDPLSGRNVFAPCGERFLDVANRSRVLEDRVITGTVRQAHDMNVSFDEAGYDGSAFEIDHAHTRLGSRASVADARESAVADGHRCRRGVPCIHRMKLAVDEHQVRFGSRIHNRYLRGGAWNRELTSHRYCRSSTCGQESTTRQLSFTHFVPPISRQFKS